MSEKRDDRGCAPSSDASVDPARVGTATAGEQQSAVGNGGPETGNSGGAASAVNHGRDCPCTPCQEEDWDVVDVRIALHDGLEYFGHEVDDVSGAVIARSPKAKLYERAMDAMHRIARQREEAKNV